MKLIMILKQTNTSKLQGTHWVPYAPINCVFANIHHLLYVIVVVNLWFSVLAEKDLRDSYKDETSFTGDKIQVPLIEVCL